MSLFNRNTVEPAPVVTGVDVLRQALRARNRAPTALVNIASDIKGTGVTQLENFINGADLDIAILQQLARILFPHSELDSDTNMLRPANRAPATSVGLITPPCDPSGWPYRITDPERKASFSPGADATLSKPYSKPPGWE